MIAIAVVAVLAAVVVAALWSRVASARADRRSVEGYGRALDTLGGVARRSESAAPVRTPKASELARPHVRPRAGAARSPVQVPPLAVPPMPRVRLRPPLPPGEVPLFSDLSPGDDVTIDDVGSATLTNEGGAALVASGVGEVLGVSADDDPGTILLPAVPAAPEPGAAGEGVPGAGTDTTQPMAVFATETEATLGERELLRVPRVSPHLAGARSERMRRIATGAAAAVALGAFGVGGWQLVANSGSHAPSGASATKGSRTAGTLPSASAGTGSSTPTGRRTRQHGGAPSASGPNAGKGGAAGSTLEPTSSSSSLVAYEAPAGRYVITFQVATTGPCWVGAQASPGGPYLWMDTVAPGGKVAYEATGPVVIRLGAPPVVSVSVNGVKVALPAGNVQPYDISFTPAARAA